MGVIFKISEMCKKDLRVLCGWIIAGIVFLFINTPVFGQNNQRPAKVFKVGIFAPLYLDSAFNFGVLKYDRSFPKASIQALDYIEGALIALDSLSASQPVEAFIYDTKSYYKPLSSLIQNKTLDNLDLMIGSVRDQDYKQLAELALKRNIPFVSSTYPNDGGVTGNPFLIIMNSTLKAHCEGIYNFIIQNHGTDKILLVKRRGDDRVANYFKALNEQEGKPALKIETVTVDSAIYSSTLKNKLDSNRKSVVIGASLDEVFARMLATACYGIKNKYGVTLIGMPNWDGFKSLLKPDAFKDFPILYSTPYFVQKGIYDNRLINEYQRLYKARPSDLVYKGYQSTYFFTKLLLAYPIDFMSHLNDKTYSIFHDFNFKPVSLNKKVLVPDYYENTHLFIMKILNGSLSREW